MERSGEDLRGRPSDELHRERQGQRGKKKRHLAEKHSRSLLLKVPKAPAQSWGLMVKGKQLGGHRGVSVEVEGEFLRDGKRCSLGMRKPILNEGFGGVTEVK